MNADASKPVESTLPLFDEQRGLNGPVTARLLRRNGFILLSLLTLGLVLNRLAPEPGLQAFGLGLWLPGAGFLFTGHPLVFVATLLLFVISLALWLLCGMMIAPPLVWLATACIAGFTAGAEVWSWSSFVVPVAVSAGLLWLRIRSRGRLPARLSAVRALNQHLARVPLKIPGSAYTVAEPLSDEDLGALRYTLDLALQPIDQWQGFNTKDQFREAGWRYQLYSMTWALAMARSTRLPAFEGYLAAAQKNAIVKMTDRRVWSYWFWENLWGNLAVNADPMRFENIMLSGWFANALGLYAATTGDRSFDQAGSLPFRWSDRKVFSYDYPRIVETIGRNFDEHSLCLFPCEPNWVFMYCNEQAMAGVKLFDRTHGTDHFDRLWPRFSTMLADEFTEADGSLSVIYSNRLGLRFSNTDSVLPYATGGVLRRVFAPDLAARNWEQLRHSHLKRDSEELFQLGKLDRLDPGEYEIGSGCFGYANLMMGAREFGDTEVYDFARRQYDALGIKHANGASKWAGSVYANLAANAGRFGAEGAWYRLGHQDYPRAWRDGPCLAGAMYPQVLVAQAVSDGAALDLVLAPGAGGGRFPLQLARLRPDQRYRVSGASDAEFTADALGRAAIEIELAQRVTLKVVPVT